GVLAAWLLELRQGEGVPVAARRRLPVDQRLGHARGDGRAARDGRAHGAGGGARARIRVRAGARGRVRVPRQGRADEAPAAPRAGVAPRGRRCGAALPDKTCRQTVKTYYGARPLHELLERCTWHSAQHARQIIAVLEGFGIRPNEPLTEKDYSGLPMPKGLWE